MLWQLARALTIYPRGGEAREGASPSCRLSCRPVRGGADDKVGETQKAHFGGRSGNSEVELRGRCARVFGTLLDRPRPELGRMRVASASRLAISSRSAGAEDRAIPTCVGDPSADPGGPRARDGPPEAPADRRSQTLRDWQCVPGGEAAKQGTVCDAHGQKPASRKRVTRRIRCFVSCRTGTPSLTLVGLGSGFVAERPEHGHQAF
jgi:hypothetical protein